MECQNGLVVRSKAGRDKGDLFVVLKLIDGYAYIVNGELRKVDRPKKKKLRHLQLTGYVSEFVANKLAAGGKITNQEVRKALAEYCEK